MERALAFYGETLGFDLKRRDIGFAEFQTNGVSLALWEVSDVTQALALAEELQAHEVLDGHAVAAAGPVPVEVGDRLELTEAGDTAPGSLRDGGGPRRDG